MLCQMNFTSRTMKCSTKILYMPELEGSKSGRYGNFLMTMMLSYMDGWSSAAIAFDISTAIMTGTVCVIWPVISNAMTPTDTVCVTAPENAAAPTRAYPPKIKIESKWKPFFTWFIFWSCANLPGMIGEMCPPYRTPYGKYKCNASPTIRPSAAPILNTGMKIPDGTGTVDAMIEKMN